MIERQALEAMDREALLAEANRQGVKRAEVMTRVELTDEILRLVTPDPVERKEVRGWLGVARDLVASIVDRGLNLPDAAAVIRGDARFEPLRRPHAPVATVTLAEIYGAQGHYTRAIAMLDEVLEKEPDHHVARRLRDRLELVSAHKVQPFSQEPAPAPPPPVDVAAPSSDQPDSDAYEAEPDEPSDPFFDLASQAEDGAADSIDAAAESRSEPERLTNGASHGALPLDEHGALSTLPPLEGAIAPSGVAPLLDEDGASSTLPPLEGGAPSRDDTLVVMAPPEPLESTDEDGTAVTLPPLEPTAPTSEEDDEDGTAQTLPPLEPPPALDEDDEDGTALTLPPSSVQAAPEAGANAPPLLDDEAPKTLAPAQQPPLVDQADDASAYSRLEPPVRRVAPSDVDWEPLPQTELAPKIAPAPPESDAVIVLRTGDTTASLYFELASAPSHEAVLRVVELRPRRTFAERVERELPVTSKGGLVTIEDLERGSIVRAAIGVREGDMFRALAVAAEVRASRGGPEVVWTPRQHADYGAVARNAALLLWQLR